MWTDERIGASYAASFCRMRKSWRAVLGKRLVIENGAEAEVNAGLPAMIAEVFAIRNQLLSGSDASIEVARMS
jgi:hypothetical protein